MINVTFFNEFLRNLIATFDLFVLIQTLIIGIFLEEYNFSTVFMPHN